MFQARRPDQLGQPSDGSIWASPMRDIAHCFPALVRNALVAMQTDINKLKGDEYNHINSMMCDYATAMAKYVDISANDPSYESVKDIMTATGLLNFPVEAHKLFGKWFARCAMGLYTASIREAKHPGDVAIGVAELLEHTGLAEGAD